VRRPHHGRSTLDAAVEPAVALAGCAERRAELRGAVRHALSRADLTRLAARLASRRLLPLIGTRALEAAGDVCPPEFEATVTGALGVARARALAVEAATRDVTATLAGHGIAALPLKGPLLAEALYGDTGLRETADVDLLVPRERLAGAAALLRQDGYAAPADPLRADGLPDLHLALDHPRRPSVELHWRVHFYEDEFARDMLERAEPGPDGLLRARPADLLASLLLFYARDGFYGLRLAADIGAWWDRYGRAGDRPLEEHARRYPRLAPALTAAAVAAERVTGAPAAGWLGGAAAHGRRTAMAAGLANPTYSGERDQLAANISLADALLAPPGTVAEFARRELVPRSGPAAPHAAKMLARYGAAAWRVRGGREWAAGPAGGGPAVELLGLRLDRVSEAEAIDHVIGALDAGRGGWLLAMNLDTLRQYARSEELPALFERADLIVADGMPLIWASRLAGTPLPARVAGSDLIWSLTAEAARNGRSVFLLGGAPGVCERAADALRARSPGLAVAGTHSPPYGFESDAAELDAIRARLREARPDVVYVGLGFPKQERLIAQLRDELPRSWFVGVGISFSFVTGDVPRAPAWLQRIGLEWVHRLTKEPRRLARRYLVDDLPFAARLAAHSLARRARGGRG
jgi:N-acetylglucosaminyldiphosphoundecaprenol N-acetyl-beta-D-mannosaminyltransferase